MHASPQSPLIDQSMISVWEENRLQSYAGCSVKIMLEDAGVYRISLCGIMTLRNAGSWRSRDQVTGHQKVRRSVLFKACYSTCTHCQSCFRSLMSAALVRLVGQSPHRRGSM